jgi:uncharacterized membrane protein
MTITTSETEKSPPEANHSSWLALNIHALLAFTIMLLIFILYGGVIYGSTQNGFLKSEVKDIVIYILGALTTIATQIVSYYFGSSSGSAEKSRALSTIAKRG